MKDQSIKAMHDYILQHGTVSMKELCDEFNLSMNTVRRYMPDILADPNIKKVYGGVSVQKAGATMRSFTERNTSKADAKMAICKKAAEHINADDIIFIDSGTSTMYLLDYIPDDMPVTVITNNLHILQAALDKPMVTLIMLPGILDRRTLSLSQDSYRYLNSLNIHKAFMACSGITVRDGASNSFITEKDNKTCAVSRADQVFLLCDSSKFGISTLQTYCHINDLDVLVTDITPDEDFITALDDNKVTLLIADSI